MKKGIFYLGILALLLSPALVSASDNNMINQQHDQNSFVTGITLSDTAILLTRRGGDCDGDCNRRSRNRGDAPQNGQDDSTSIIQTSNPTVLLARRCSNCDDTPRQRQRGENKGNGSAGTS